jgi:transmembrane sensor
MMVRRLFTRDAERQSPTDAAAWIARVRSGTMSGQEKDELEAWLAQSDRNRDEYRAVGTLLLDLDGLRSHPEVMALREQARQPGWSKRAMAVAATVCLLMTGAAATIALLRSSYFSERPAMSVVTAFYETREGQRSSLTLSDGSRLFLDSSSAVKAVMDGSTRRIQLLKGRADFVVAKDHAHPFIVSAGDRTVTALGTQFDINLAERSVEIVLLEGRVVVQPRNRATESASAVVMTPGYRLVARDGNWTMAAVDLAAASRWRDGILVFDEARLGDIVAEMNRYVSTKIVIGAPALADQRMSAVLKAGDISTFLSAIDTIGVARWRQLPGHGYELLEAGRKNNSTSHLR